jgi:hypothetical protein
LFYRRIDVFISIDKFKEQGVSRRLAQRGAREGCIRTQVRGGHTFYSLPDYRAYSPPSRLIDPTKIKSLLSDYKTTGAAIGREIGYTKQMMSFVLSGKNPISPKMELYFNQWLSTHTPIRNKDTWVGVKVSALFKREP